MAAKDGMFLEKMRKEKKQYRHPRAAEKTKRLKHPTNFRVGKKSETSESL